MLFSSMTFLFAFLPVVMVFYFVPFFTNNSEKELAKKNLVLCLFSLIFYAWGEPVYIILMLISIYFNYNIGLDIQHLNNINSEKKKKVVLALAVLFNIAVLGYFKYSAFFVSNINSLFGTSIAVKQLSLPIGISFYTFQAISYLVDVYRSKSYAQNSLLKFALYISMFPQLIAGPIVQYSDIEYQLNNRNISVRKFTVGLLFFIRGLGKKVIFANSIGVVCDKIMGGDIKSLPALTAWLGILCYTMQIYFDFSGYSDMAVGLGRMFGFDLIHNFRFPYVAKSIKDFWSRWHISLSLWFRDYVYIPLGGNRKGTARTIFNTSIVWLLTGLWHGAQWNFVAWGAYYGLLLIAEKFVFNKILDKIPLVIRHILTMLLVMVGWVFFRAENLSWAAQYLMSMFALNGNALANDQTWYYFSTNCFMLILMCASAFGIFNNMPKIKRPTVRLTLQAITYLAIFAVCIVFLVGGTYNPFLYFRF